VEEKKKAYFKCVAARKEIEKKSMYEVYKGKRNVAKKCIVKSKMEVLKRMEEKCRVNLRGIEKCIIKWIG
jgi:hypothetical protein